MAVRDGGKAGERRPSAAELTAARGRTIPDVAGPGLRVLFTGINPSLYSAATGYHFARPGNRFWRTLHAAGFTERVLLPSEQQDLLAAGLGITNIVARATARADELSGTELRAGARALAAKVARLRPAWLAIAGISAYRTAFGKPGAGPGPQPEPMAGARVWVLPNPSGLNAHWTPPSLAAEYARLREAAGLAPAEGAVSGPATPG
ncbi:MAG: G/U mismatch-specific DNA glycosylase [Actinobacteria bacterium]|nr:G/U mismatch-specific DNA glycosylase [Actinomycetota bacterium]